MDSCKINKSLRKKHLQQKLHTNNFKGIQALKFNKQQN